MWVLSFLENNPVGKGIVTYHKNLYNKDILKTAGLRKTLLSDGKGHKARSGLRKGGICSASGI
jgi:hypothetical protein